jgi:AmmeMemoRadiSam system protein B
MKVRVPAVAGQFYTGDPDVLSDEVRRYLDLAPVGDQQPPGIIVPHAGHMYSGPVAAYAYRTLHQARRIVLVGPAHYVPVAGMVAPAAEVWRTPLGDVPIDTATIGELGLPIDDHPHAPEHSLEVQIPFLQVQLAPGWSLLPLLVGRADPTAVADILQGFLTDSQTVVVLSTDLSHYLPYAQATLRDESTAARIVARDWQHIADQDACGAYPLRGLLLATQRLDMDVRLLDLRNSGDTAGPHDRVVGYGAFTVGL